MPRPSLLAFPLSVALLLSACTGGDPNVRFTDVVMTADATLTLDIPDLFVPSICPETPRFQKIASAWLEVSVDDVSMGSFPADIRSITVSGTDLYYGAMTLGGAEIRKVGIDGMGDQRAHAEPGATFLEHLTVHEGKLYFYATLGEQGTSFRSIPLTGGSSEAVFEQVSVTTDQAPQHFAQDGSHLVLGYGEGTNGSPFQNRLLRRSAQNGIEAIFARNTSSPFSSPHASLGGIVYVAAAKADGLEERMLLAIPMDAAPVDTATPPPEGDRIFSTEVCTSLATSGTNNLFCLGPIGTGDDQPTELRHYATDAARPVTGRSLFDGNHAAAEGGKLTSLLAASDGAAFVVTASPNGFSSVIYKVDLQGTVTVLACKSEPVLDLVYSGDTLYFAVQSSVQDAHGIYRLKQP